MKAAIYCRLSEEDRHKQLETDDSASIQNQKNLLLAYALEQGWELYDIYSDEDYAGADRRRPAFNRLLQDAKEHRFDIVLCKTQSRFTRELELVEKYLHGLFPLWGIRFVSVVDNADTANKGNKKSRQINGLVNEWYLEDLSENIRSVLTSRRKAGLHIGSFALYGYRKDPDQKGHLVIDPPAAAVVREVFTLFSQGFGKTAIARLLNDRGIPNPTEYKRLQGLRYSQPKGKGSTLWRYPAIARMLSNPIYTGTMVQGKYGSISYKTKENRPRPKSQWYTVSNTHQPIVPRELWDRVQSLLSQRAKPFSTGTLGIFAGKARCAHCGYAMRSTKSRGRYYLQCATRRAAKDACPGSFLPVKRLEEAVLEELNRLAQIYLDPSLAGKGWEMGGTLLQQRNQLCASLRAHRKKTGEYGECLRSLYLDRANGVIAPRDFEELSRSFSLERDRLEEKIRQEETRLAQLNQVLEKGNLQSCPCPSVPPFLTRELVELLIHHINVGSRDPSTGVVPVEIHWNF